MVSGFLYTAGSRSVRVLRLIAFVLAGLAPLAHAEDACKQRGDLDTPYCDANSNLVADLPTDPSKWKSPDPLMFAYAPVEDPSIYERMFKPFTEYLAQCTGRRVAFFPVQSNTAEIEAMRTSRLHVAWFSTGPTMFAVNVAGAVPFAVKGTEKGAPGYRLMAIVKSTSPYRKLSDLKDKKVAHTSPSSNSGHLAPVALFPANGLVPGKDYKIIFTGKHDVSILGVASGDYDAAAIASDVLDRLIAKGEVKQKDIRVIYESQRFPTETVAYAHDLEPKLRDQMIKCFHDYRFTPEMRGNFDGADRFVPVEYKKDFAVVRQVAESAGEHFNRAAYDNFAKRKK